ncbi:uncharacterized protein EHS24_007439 [Apiotrichum porosum]|uniref:Uncharacterized protein n=1 Tax=Apiotrichum porosum TaxID=105984 RepID=A0A427XUQ6_9TREE|nr:uncharacterized protein EHS24_007439 [Apiotrichum porosum]RSH82465.1 hypothetical protein EHS24_007439 [Apiotrichum porosum]
MDDDTSPSSHPTTTSPPGSSVDPVPRNSSSSSTDPLLSPPQAVRPPSVHSSRSSLRIPADSALVADSAADSVPDLLPPSAPSKRRTNRHSLPMRSYPHNSVNVSGSGGVPGARSDLALSSGGTHTATATAPSRHVSISAPLSSAPITPASAYAYAYSTSNLDSYHEHDRSGYSSATTDPNASRVSLHPEPLRACREAHARVYARRQKAAMASSLSLATSQHAGSTGSAHNGGIGGGAGWFSPSSVHLPTVDAAGGRDGLATNVMDILDETDLSTGEKDPKMARFRRKMWKGKEPKVVKWFLRPFA